VGLGIPCEPGLISKGRHHITYIYIPETPHESKLVETELGNACMRQMMGDDERLLERARCRSRRPPAPAGHFGRRAGVIKGTVCGERGEGKACEVRGTSGQRERGPNAGRLGRRS
jgi:hypothetical protein